jgi:hypothetical protein
LNLCICTDIGLLSEFNRAQCVLNAMSLRSPAADVPSRKDGSTRPNPLTYPKSAETFSSELFKNPTNEYRGCPLWAWNTELKEDQLKRQIDNFEAMGMGGFHMHVRTGLDTDYLGSEFMDIVRSCVEYAESKGMLACLYVHLDQARPSLSLLLSAMESCC